MTETLYGFRNVAAEPTPLAFPAPVPKVLPPPASDVTTAVAITTARMRWLITSATYRAVAAVLSARRVGKLKSAFVPVPS